MTSETYDGALTILLIAGFALLVCAHVATLFGLAKKRELVPATVGLVFPPAAPYWAFARGMRLRGALWIVAAVVYVVAVLLGR